VDATKDLRVSQVLDALDEMLTAHIFPPATDGTNPRACPTCGTGRLSLKMGKFGAFIGCSNYPECRYTRPLSGGEAAPEGDGVRKLGADPESGLEVTVRDGRFGAYLQLGEAAEGEKPKRSSLPKEVTPATIDLDTALKLLALPREIGRHPDDQEPILAGIGRYGPYVQHGRIYANLEAGDDILAIGLNRAIALIADKQSKGRGGRGGAAAAGRTIGDHPTLGGAITVRAGRFGPYVNHGKVNATLPKSVDPETLSLEQAVELINAKAAASPAKPARGGARKAKPAETADGEAPAKKPAAKKAPAKKTAAKSPAKATAAKSATAKAGAAKKPAKAG
jgi:DNA topoisomerase-1